MKGLSMTRRFAVSGVWMMTLSAALVGCDDETQSTDPTKPEATIAEGIFARPGEIMPAATAEQKEVFDRGLEVARRRFTPEEGLGPQFNVSFCGACHEKPDFGGTAGRYRNFYITAEKTADGAYLPVPEERGGVVSSYGTVDGVTRPRVPEVVNVSAQRNPIPFFGIGLIAELPDEVILANADPDDADGDGVSGRPNYSDGFLGRFGTKSQTANIEGFIRGPLNNHAGITSNPLTEDERARLPVPSNADGNFGTMEQGLAFGVVTQAQAAAPGTPLFDDDDVPDPELSNDDLFALVSWAMLLAAPVPDAPTAQTERGLTYFTEIGCASCHVPTLEGPRGLVPLYSDLLLHDMGEENGDGIEMGLATASEFRTQPLWGLAANAPYMSDGRADTIEEAIMAHGGEGERARKAYMELEADQKTDLEEFLLSLGGRSEVDGGMLHPETPVPEVGATGGPTRPLTSVEEEKWIRGRAVYDREFFRKDGLGPYFNGDSCRACHFDPIIGGAGPIGVNVMRTGTFDDEGEFISPEYGTLLAKLSDPHLRRREHGTGHNVFEPRQTPTTLGLGLIESISEEAIVANADPEDLDGDGIRGVAHYLADGRLGRFGWKAGVPSIKEFIRDAMSNELGLTVPEEEGFTFGFLEDADGEADPEAEPEMLDDLAFFMEHLGAPAPKSTPSEKGLSIFEQVGCADCHTPALPGADGPVNLFSDLLLHDVVSMNHTGIVEAGIEPRLYRTPPLWGISDTAPYMHDGSASNLDAAIMAHFAEGEAARVAYEALTAEDRGTLIEFLEQL
ncbi:MAG: di-heme oxidoredictase family protein [Bradymonadia bacterium]